MELALIVISALLPLIWFKWKYWISSRGLSLRRMG